MANAANDSIGNILCLLKDLAPLVSYASLLLGVFLLWLTKFHPFNPKATFSGITLIPKVIKNAKNIQLFLGVQVTIYNSGAKGGFIEDIAIKMSSLPPNNFNTMYYPYMFYDSQKLLKDKFNNLPDLLSMKGTFSGIFIPPKSNVTSEILFGMEQVVGQTTLQPGK